SAFYRPPLAVFAPADAIDISGDITISGVPSQKPNGKFLLVAVQVEQPTGLGVLWAIVHPDRDVVPISSFLPEGIPEQEFTRQQRGLFDESQLLAAAAAAQAAGLQVTVSGTGVRVLGTVPRSPAADQLRDGDVITAVNGSPVRIAEDLRRAVSSEPPGTPFVLRVEREGGELEVEIRSARLPTPDGSPAIGVLIETRDIDVDLPFEIQFRDRNVGGPSAGLAYALAIADMLDPEDIARDRTIAASGTIQLDGEVGLVGGLSQKAEAAEDADADLMLVPLEEIGELQDADLPVRGVDNLADALSLLTRA
ncbi:MAG: PDZ domain-containing protein, partial [Actinomycetota bacterium]